MPLNMVWGIADLFNLLIIYTEFNLPCWMLREMDCRKRRKIPVSRRVL